MKSTALILLVGGVFATGCHTAKEVAVTSFRVIDAPARYVRQRIDSPGTTRTTTQVVESDTVMNPGRPIEPAPEPRRRVTTTTTSREADIARRSTPRSSPAGANSISKPSSAQSPQRLTTPPSTAQFPTAKPVPGKAGYVFSPFDPSGGYVDVNGYTSGQKVKDPYSGKIFLVP